MGNHFIKNPLPWKKTQSSISDSVNLKIDHAMQFNDFLIVSITVLKRRPRTLDSLFNLFIEFEISEIQIH